MDSCSSERCLKDALEDIHLTQAHLPKIHEFAHNESPCSRADPKHLSSDSFERMDVIGRGAYSIVYSARHLASGQLVALKEIHKRTICTMNLNDQLKQEINLMRTIRHPHVVRLLSYFVDSTHVVLVLELCPGTLRRKLSLFPNGKFDERRASKYARQLAKALHYLHQRSIVHRDLKLENILLDDFSMVKLADFGWSSELGRSTRSTVCGTLDYLSPEMISRCPHSEKTDVWSLGAIIFEMICGRAPFYSPSEVDTAYAILHHVPQIPSFVSPSARELITIMLRKDPNARPTMLEVLQHPWMQRYQSTQKIAN